MKWISYPTDRDRKEGRNGTPREGQVVSDAPPPGGKWVLTDDKKFHLVITRAGKAWEVGA